MALPACALVQDIPDQGRTGPAPAPIARHHWRPLRASWLDRMLYRDEREWLDRDPGGAQAQRVMRDLERFNHRMGIDRTCRLLVERYLPTASARILDVACGSGFNASALADLDGSRGSVRITGIDLSRDHLAHHRWRRPRLSRCQADACHLPFADATFDVGICAQSLHHLAPSLVIALVLEMRRTCRISIIYDLRRTWYGTLASLLVGLAYSREFAQDGTRSHRRSYTVAELRELFAFVGIRASVEACSPIHLAVTVPGED